MNVTTLTGSTARPTDTVAAALTWPVAAVDGRATMRQVAEALTSDEVGAVVVLEDGHLVGIVSERDLAHHLADGAHPDHLLADEMMSDDLVTAHVDDTLLHVAQRMVECGVRHLPVVGDDERLAGMVSMRDVHGVLLESVSRGR